MITPIGATLDQFRSSIRTGRSGIGQVDRFDTSPYRSTLGALVPVLPDGPEGADACTKLALWASGAAMADAGLELSEEERRRTGLVLGTCVSGLASAEAFMAGHGEQPELLLQYPPGAITGELARHLGIWGETRAVMTACAAGTNAVGAGADLIRFGRCDLVLAGGADPFCEMPYGGFNSLEALSPEPCRPFDQNRSGITLGEGAAILVLEAEERALARGARIYAEVCGYGLSNDAYHTTAPDPSGDGAYRAMEAALHDAGIEAGQIAYVNAHGTGTPANDAMEIAALERLFGTDPVPASSTKAQTGHCLGAAGSIEAAACCVAIFDQILPATAGHQTPLHPTWDFVPMPGGKAQPGPVMSNSFAFGGNMASLVLAPYQKGATGDGA